MLICFKHSVSRHTLLILLCYKVFFAIATEEFGFTVEKIYEEKWKSYPFVENDGKYIHLYFYLDGHYFLIIVTLSKSHGSEAFFYLF
jgi:hypothetical protein